MFRRSPLIPPEFKLLTRDKNSCANMSKIARNILRSKSHSRPKEFRREKDYTDYRCKQKQLKKSSSNRDRSIFG
jgi:hypothetical protein